MLYPAELRARIKLFVRSPGARRGSSSFYWNCTGHPRRSDPRMGSAWFRLSYDRFPMSGCRCWILTLLGVGLIAASPTRPFAQSTPSLAALTVPVERLPDGCRLEPVIPDGKGGRRFVMYPGIRENPWLGTGRQYAASIRQVVDGPAGPRYGLSGPELHDRLADDVVESYRARYISANQQRIDVYAVRFNDPALTRAAALNQLLPDASPQPRIILGSAAVLVLLSGPATPSGARGAGERCRRAVTDHVVQLSKLDR